MTCLKTDSIMKDICNHAIFQFVRIILCDEILKSCSFKKSTWCLILYNVKNILHHDSCFTFKYSRN
jgi:hypothetical protein